MNFIGLDLGQKQDFSAVAVVERPEQRMAFLSPTVPTLSVKHLERLPLGTAYADVVGGVSEIVQHPALAQRSCLVVDATGVGAPVVEMLRAARLPCRVIAVTITGGEQAHGRSEAWHVPKKDLMAGLQVLLEGGHLKIHRKLRESATLVRELRSIRMDIRASSRSPNGEHDDLVLAVALACWRARKIEPGRITQRLPGI